MLTKREADQRVLGLDVSGKLRDGDTVSNFLSVTAKVAGGTADTPEALEVSPYSTAPIVDNEAEREMSQLQFNCSGGTAGALYLLALRYMTPVEPVLESPVYVRVL